MYYSVKHQVFYSWSVETLQIGFEKQNKAPIISQNDFIGTFPVGRVPEAIVSL